MNLRRDEPAPPLLPYAAIDGPEDGAGLRGMFNTLLQNAQLLAIVFGGALAIAIIYLLFAPSVYRADALIQLEDRKQPPSLVGGPLQASALQLPAAPLQGEIEILRSRELMLKSVLAAGADIDIAVANRMALVGPPYAKWHAANRAGVADAPIGLRGFAWGGESLRLAEFELPPGRLDRSFTLRGLGLGSQWVLLDHNDVVIAKGKVGQRLEFELDRQPASLHVAELRGRHGVEFSVEKHSPSIVYENLLKKLQVSESTRQSGVIRIVYETSDRERALRLLDELTRNYVQNTIQRRTAEAEQSLRFLEEQLPELKRKLDSSEHALATFRARTNTLNVDQETQSSLLRSAQLARDRVELQLKGQLLSQRFLPNHPELQAVARQSGFIDAEVNRLNKSAAALPANQRDYVRLQRDVQTNSTLYTALLTSAQEVQLARAGMTANARIVDPPGATELPVKPQPAVVLSLAAGLGLLGGIALAFVRRQLRPTVQDAEDIELHTGLLTLAYIPESNRQRKMMRWSLLPTATRPRLLATHAPSEPAIESLRSFRSSLTLPSSGNIEKTVLIAAPTAGLGKTFIAANLAALMGAANKRVLLIDADLRRPRLHRYFRAPSAPGLAEILTGDANFNDVTHREVLPNLDLLLAGRARRNPADLLTSPGLRRLLDGLEQRYDCVIIDSAPVLPVADALTFAQFGLQTFLVARSEHTTVREVREAARRIDAVGGRVQGVLFNGVKRARFGGLSYYAYPEGA